MSASEPAQSDAAELAALRQEIEQVHAEVHELADRLEDLEVAWARLPGWVRRLVGVASPTTPPK